MRKTTDREQSKQGRVLARVLAEDLRNIQVTGGGATPEITLDDGHGHRDITNVGGDGDLY